MAKSKKTTSKKTTSKPAKFDPRKYCEECNERHYQQKAERVLMAHEKRSVTPFTIREREEKLAAILEDLRTNSDPMGGVVAGLRAERDAFMARACSELGGLTAEQALAVLDHA